MARQPTCFSQKTVVSGTYSPSNRHWPIKRNECESIKNIAVICDESVISVEEELVTPTVSLTFSLACSRLVVMAATSRNARCNNCVPLISSPFKWNAKLTAGTDKNLKTLNKVKKEKKKKKNTYSRSMIRFGVHFISSKN
uniref:Uncharacterized protein n=1 Tax=Glossina palpalis gambiensis TaxID=67801 RepID=A0A1B0ANV4_9MUSC